MISEDEILLSYSWLKTDLFKRIIRKDYPDARNIIAEDFSVKAALGPGENYTSTMIRATVNYFIDGKKVQKRFIIKAGHCKKEVRAMLKVMRLFEREITMYQKIIPKVEQLLASIGDNCKLAAKCYDIMDDLDDPYIIFEDLTCQNYKNVDRRIGLNVAEYKKALSKIARWHAATIVLLEETNYEDYPDILDYSSMMEADAFANMINNCYRAASMLTKTMPGFEHLSEKLENCFPNILPRIKNVIRSEKSFIGLVHGDLWMNNIMFTHDSNGQPINALLCDFQAPYRGPVILDVINHLLTSSAESIQDREWDILVQYYHNERTDILKKLGYSKRIPSLTETQREFIEKGVVYSSMVLMTPGARNLENKGETIADFLGEGDAKVLETVKVMGNPKCRKTFEFLLDYCSRKGYFE